MNASERKQRIAALLTGKGPATGNGSTIGTGVASPLGHVIGLGDEESGEALGITGLDERLPAHGLPKAAVSEILSAQGLVGTGAITLLLPMIARITQAGRRVALVDHGLGINPLAFANAGVRLEMLMLLRPPNAKDALWVTDLCAKNKAIALTIAGLDRLRELDIRHLQLSAERGESATVLLRPARAASSAAAALRMRVSPLAGQARALRVEFLRTRGAFPPAPVIVEVKDRGQALDVYLRATAALPAFAAVAASASA